MPPSSGAEPAPPSERGRRTTRGQVPVPAGTFAMGDAFGEGYAGDGERPVHDVTLPAYLVDATTVTNAAFSAFVKATGYRTTAEQAGSSAVLHLAVERAGTRQHVVREVPGTPWWWEVRGASWRAPEGPGSTSATRANHPVVHVSHHDAEAYCSWAGKRLPSEAEWERAARGGLTGARFPWGDEREPGGRWAMNIWQGTFPTRNTEDDGHLTTAPVKSYRPNGFGLWQVAGNVWEWCADRFDPTYYERSPALDPRGPATGDLRVMRGGSYLCDDSYCDRYRLAARSATTPDSSAANLGFRCANDA
ncbi:MAG: formylglycine-generating enzyme family protein [Nocardioides sp.]|nr:formylglycine-generating enzyme family protein [Nocardioides sp.]